MKLCALLTAFILTLCCAHNVQAQGTTYLSNLGQPPASLGSVSIIDAVGTSAWRAAGFQTGNNAEGYVLNSIQLEMGDGYGNPNGFIVMLYANSQPQPPNFYLPGNALETLNGSSNPATSGVYTYASPVDFTLSPNTSYFIVMTAATSVGSLNDGTYPMDGYSWILADANLYNPSGGWAGLGSWNSGNGSYWQGNTSYFPQFAINATAVPEPTIFGLFVLGGLLFVRHRNKTKAV